jgi:hypothetical protein
MLKNMVSENELKGIKKYRAEVQPKTYLEYLKESDTPQWMKDLHIKNYKENANNETKESF